MRKICKWSDAQNEYELMHYDKEDRYDLFINNNLHEMTSLELVLCTALDSALRELEMCANELRDWAST